MPSEIEVENRIRRAYVQTQDEFGWASLTRLRGKLGDLPRDEVDAALDRMIEQPSVQLIHALYQMSLTDADWAAAVVIGGEPRHEMKIDDPRQSY